MIAVPLSELGAGWQYEDGLGKSLNLYLLPIAG
jgi:hypothetical protein